MPRTTKRAPVKYTELKEERIYGALYILDQLPEGEAPEYIRQEDGRRYYSVKDILDTIRAMEKREIARPTITMRLKALAERGRLARVMYSNAGVVKGTQGYAYALPDPAKAPPEVRAFLAEIEAHPERLMKPSTVAVPRKQRPEGERTRQYFYATDQQMRRILQDAARNGMTRDEYIAHRLLSATEDGAAPADEQESAFLDALQAV